MRRHEIKYRPEAVADLDDVFRFVLRLSDSQATAERFIGRILARCQRIGNVPLGGRPRDDLEPGLRIVPFEKTTVVAYKVETDCVRIVNVFYGGRDYEALYRNDAPKDEGL